VAYNIQMVENEQEKSLSQKIIAEQRAVAEDYENWEENGHSQEALADIRRRGEQVIKDTIAVVCKPYPGNSNQEKMVRGLFTTLEIRDRTK